MQETDLPTDSFVKLRLKLSVSLYYKLLDSIMRDEERKNADYGALQVKNELRNFCLVFEGGVLIWSLICEMTLHAFNM